MTAWIDPAMLHILGLGTSGDPYAQDGRHLRWFFAPTLGFPRTGFRLRRRRAPLTWNDEVLAGSGLVQNQSLVQGAVTSSPQRFASGITVAKRNGLAFTTVFTGAPAYLRVDSRDVMLDFGHTGPSPVPPVGPEGSNPAAYVCLFFARRRRTGRIDVRGFANRGDSFTYMTRASRTPSGGLLNDWVSERLVVHASLLEHLEIVGRDAALSRVEWVSVRNYVTLYDWATVDTFYLPLTDAPTVYPPWTATPGIEIARHRLMLAPPRARAPWDEPTYPPPPAPPSEIEEDLTDRYLGAGFAAIDMGMRQFLKHELSAIEPQESAEATHTLTAEETSPLEGTGLSFHPFRMLYAHALDPQVARALGLMTTDYHDATSVAYDYSVDASWDPLWIQWYLNPLLGLLAAKFRREGTPWSPPWGGSTKLQHAYAIVTGIARAPAAAPLAVEDLRADVEGWVPGSPVQARTQLSWKRDPSSYYDNTRRFRVFYAVRRSGPDGDVPLHERDPDTKRAIPRAVGESITKSGRAKVWDSSIPAYAGYTWRMSGMDLFGRFSPFAQATAVVSDVIAPPSPRGVRAALLGPAAAAPAWSAIRIAFDWLEAQESNAHDLARFEVHVVQGRVTAAEARLPTTWGRFEHSPGASAPPIEIAWPGLAPAVPPGLTATVSTTPIDASQGGGRRITIEVGPINRPYDAGGVAAISATVTAVDTWGNASSFASFDVAMRADEFVPPPPPQPPGLLYSSRVDWLGRAFFRLPLAISPGQFAFVLRASANALVDQAGTDVDAFAAMSEADRLAHVRALATTRRKSFAADHELPYDSTATSHVARLNGNDLGWTVFVVVPASATYVQAAWPTDPSAFAVVAVPHIPRLRMPAVDEIRGGDRQVTLRILPDTTGATASFRVYRTREEAHAAEIRRMRPIADLPASADPVTFADLDVYPDVPYFYRVIAVDAEGIQSAPTNPRSAVAWSSVPPDPPLITSVIKPVDPTIRYVRVRVPRRDYGLTIFRRRRGLPAWSFVYPARPDGTIDVIAHTPTLVDGVWELQLVDVIPAGEEGAVWAYRARATDRNGRHGDSSIEEEVTP